jgi:glyoxylase-like metal-dependent hydrolase (beta-lactamase superfamily II)
MSEIKTIQVGMIGTNCYLVLVPKSKRLYIIDPGAETDRILDAASKLDFDQAFILLTHAHVDHISAVGEIAAKLNAKVLLDNADHGMYSSPDNHLMPFVPAAKNLPQPVTEISNPDFEIIKTPGHSPGGVCFYFKNIPALFSGDTLFAQSIGRTDLPGGNMSDLLKSIKDKLMLLPENLKVYPGHGPTTTIGDEKRNNPYV